MNKTKIEWTQYSWNPITGCLHGCWYCYAKKLCLRFKKIFPNGFEPTFHPERLKEPWELKKPSKIFVCSIADLFASWTPISWRYDVLDSIFECPINHTFQLLTKNPENIDKQMEFSLSNVWIGATVNTKEDFWRIDEMRKVRASVRFISFEPLLGSMEGLNFEGINWVIVGKLTGARRVKLEFSWLADIFDQTAQHQIPLFMKNNLKEAFPELRMIQEFPKVA